MGKIVQSIPGLRAAWLEMPMEEMTHLWEEGGWLVVMEVSLAKHHSNREEHCLGDV